MSEKLLEAKHLTKIYTDDKGTALTACDDIDLVLHKGETLGIVGESGCGKSTLLKLITQLERPSKGNLYMLGKDITDLKKKELRLSRRHIQMVFQDPSSSFFPRMKAGNAVSEPLRNFERLSKKEVDNRVNDMLELVQLPKEYANRYPHSMSGGQRQRLGIARALILNPDILVCDEATCSLDVSVQKQIIELLVGIQRQRELSIIFVCHDLALIQSFSHRVMVMYLGNVVEVLPGNKVKDSAYHPYTNALINSIFTVDMDSSKPIKLLEGEVPSAIDLPSGCPFHTRCSYRQDICMKKKPKLREIAENHQIACHIIDI